METRNSGRVDQWSHCVESRYVSSASGTDISTATEASSLDCHFCGVDSPPAVELNGGKGDQWISWTKPFVQGWTHTHTRIYIYTYTGCSFFICRTPKPIKTPLFDKSGPRHDLSVQMDLDKPPLPKTQQASLPTSQLAASYSTSLHIQVCIPVLSHFLA